MRRTTRVTVAALVVLAALVGGVGHVGATSTTTAAATAAPAQEDCSFPTTLTDASGTEVTLEEEPEEIVTLGASSAQTVWELGEQDRVTGMPVGPSTSYLNGSDDRTHVLDGVNVQIETVVDLDPDLVIAPAIIAPDDVQALRDAGLTVYRENDASSVEDARDRTRTTGQLLGACDAADETVAWMNDSLDAVESTVEGEDSPSVFYWLGGGYTAGSATFQHEGLQIAGADNAAANMGIERSGPAESEPIVAEDPDYILVTEGTELPSDHPIQQTSAVQDGNVITVDGNDWNQPAPRFVLAIEEVSRQLHPEAYEAAEQNGTEGETDASDGSGANASDGSAANASDEGTSNGDEPNASDDGGDDGLPGFGVPVAIAALLGTLVALGRRP